MRYIPGGSIGAQVAAHAGGRIGKSLPSDARGHHSALAETTVRRSASAYRGRPSSRDRASSRSASSIARARLPAIISSSLLDHIDLVVGERDPVPAALIRADTSGILWSAPTRGGWHVNDHDIVAYVVRSVADREPAAYLNLTGPAFSGPCPYSPAPVWTGNRAT